MEVRKSADLAERKLTNRERWLVATSFLGAAIVDLYRWRGFPKDLFNLVPQNTDYTFHIWQVAKVARNGLRLPNESVMVDSFDQIFWSYQYGAHLIPGLISDGSISSSGTSISLFLFLTNNILLPVLLAILVWRYSKAPISIMAVPIIHLISPNLHLGSLGLFAFNIGTILLVSCLILLDYWSKKRDYPSLLVLSISIVSLGATHKSLLAFFAFVLAIVCVRDLVRAFLGEQELGLSEISRSQVILFFLTVSAGYFLIFFNGNYGVIAGGEQPTSLSVLKYLFGERVSEKNLADSFSSPLMTLLGGGSYASQSTSVVYGVLAIGALLWVLLRRSNLGLLTIGLTIVIVSRVVTATVDIHGLRKWLAGIWLGESHRVAPISDIFLICVISIFVAALAEGMNLGTFRTIATVWITGLLLVSGMSAGTTTDTFRGWMSPGKSRVISPAEVSGFQEIDRYLPSGSRVFNFFGDGSSLAHFESEVGVTWVWGDISSDPSRVPKISADLDAHAQSPSPDSFETVSTGFASVDVCGILISSGNVHAWAPAWWEMRSFEGFDQLVLSEDVMLFVYSDPPERCQV